MIIEYMEYNMALDLCKMKVVHIIQTMYPYINHLLWKPIHGKSLLLVRYDIVYCQGSDQYNSL
jgi:hypothetical protein